MKKITLLLFVIFNVINPSIAQGIDPKIGHVVDEISSYNLAIVENKSKMGVYNPDDSSFVIPMSKSRIFYSVGMKMVFQVDKNKIIKLYPLRYFEPDENGLLKVELSRENNLWFDYTFDGHSYQIKDEYLSYYLGLEVQKYHIIFNDYVPTNYGPPIMSIAYPGEDSIDADGNFVYEIIDPINNSGVFNIKTGNWDIPQQYRMVGFYNGFYFCLGNNKFEDKWIEYFDIYQLSGKEIKPTEYKNIRYNKDFPAELVFGKGNVERQADEVSFNVKSKEGTRLVRAQLFSRTWVYQTNKYVDYMGNFLIDTIIKEPQERIWMVGPDRQRFYIAKNQSHHALYTEYYDSLVVSPFTWDSIFFMAIDVREGYRQYCADGILYRNEEYNDSCPGDFDCLIKEKAFGEIWRNFADVGFEMINDSLVYIQDHLQEFDGPYPVAVQSMYWGEDSIDVDGNVVYYPGEPGNYGSGIYNLKNHNWEVPPQYAFIIHKPDGYLLASPVLNENGNLLNYSFDYLNIDGSYRFKDVEERDFYAFDNWMNYLIPHYWCDTLYNTHTDDRDYFTDVYFETNGKMGVAGMLSGNLIYSPKPYIFYDPYDRLAIYIENSTLFVDIEDLSTQFPLDGDFNIGHSTFTNQGDFAYLTFNESASSKALLFDFQNRTLDTLSAAEIYSKYQINIDANNYNPEAKYTQRNWTLKALNDSTIYIEYWIDKDRELISLYNEWGEDSLDENGNIVYYAPSGGAERSGIFNHKQNKWIISPEYFRIAPLKKGYLVESREYRINWQYWGAYGLYDFTFAYFDENGAKQGDFMDPVSFFDQAVDLANFVPLENVDTAYFATRNIEMGEAVPEEMKVIFHSDQGMGIYDLLNGEFIVKPSIFLIYNPELGRMATLEGDSLHLSKVRYDCKIESTTAYAVSRIEKDSNAMDLSYKPISPEAFYAKGFVVNTYLDSLIIINSAAYEVIPLLWSIEYPGEDSIDYEGNTVYGDTIPGVYQSGVFNIGSNEWLIQPENIWVIPVDLSFLLICPVRNEGGLLIDKRYSLIDEKGNLILEKVLIEELPAELKAKLPN